MKTLFYVLGLCGLMLLSSCIEIIDDLSLNSNGSGTFKYNINLSSSKVKINSLLALDSLDGKRVPKIGEIKSKINRVIADLKEQEGITEVTFDSDYDDYMFKLSCHFKSLEALQTAVKNVIIKESGNSDIPELEYDWLTFDKSVLKRSVPKITIQKTKEINQKEIDLLKEGKYTSITRFEREIQTYENKNARVSKNNKAIMLSTDPYSLTQNPNLLDNSIRLVKQEE